MSRIPHTFIQVRSVGYGINFSFFFFFGVRRLLENEEWLSFWLDQELIG